MITCGMELERSTISPAAGDHPFFPPLDRALIERVACAAPEAYELEVTRWDCRTLQKVVVAQTIVGAIHYTTVARFLQGASLQPLYAVILGSAINQNGRHCNGLTAPSQKAQRAGPCKRYRLGALSS
jgi:hypothetical protein